MACLCLHSPKTTKKTSLIRRIQERQYAIFKLYGNKIFLKISNVVPTLRNSYTLYPILRYAFSDQEYSEEEVAETMAKTMEQYMSKTRADYGSGDARPKIEDKDNFELKGQFLKELRTNTFSGSDHEDANEHIEKVLEIVDLFHIPNTTID
ncbi:hypothetical protein Tco_1110392 [Tanacetum coccineum]|uniref:Uncharacterized protein n=1 Tax=Tanacetum coccineum TaxID=301880 RepID=A0ABQ5IIP3_9ASTR